MSEEIELIETNGGGKLFETNGGGKLFEINGSYNEKDVSTYCLTETRVKKGLFGSKLTKKINYTLKLTTHHLKYTVDSEVKPRTGAHANYSLHIPINDVKSVTLSYRKIKKNYSGPIILVIISALSLPAGIVLIPFSIHYALKIKKMEKKVATFEIHTDYLNDWRLIHTCIPSKEQKYMFDEINSLITEIHENPQNALNVAENFRNKRNSCQNVE